MFAKMNFTCEAIWRADVWFGLFGLPCSCEVPLAYIAVGCPSLLFILLVNKINSGMQSSLHRS